MKTSALDSWAILEWIAGRQPAADLVGRMLTEAEDGRIQLFMSAINVGEVYYFLRKQHSGTPTPMHSRLRWRGSITVRWLQETRSSGASINWRSLGLAGGEPNVPTG